MPLKRLAPILLLLAGLTAFYVCRLDRWITFEALAGNRALLKRLVVEHAILAALGFALVYAVTVAFSLPLGLWFTIAGGFLFGVVWGTALSVIAATSGAICVFLAARYAFHDALHRRASGWIGRFEAGFRRNAVGYLLFLVLSPSSRSGWSIWCLPFLACAFCLTRPPPWSG